MLIKRNVFQILVRKKIIANTLDPKQSGVLKHHSYLSVKYYDDNTKYEYINLIIYNSSPSLVVVIKDLTKKLFARLPILLVVFFIFLSE